MRISRSRGESVFFFHSFKKTTPRGSITFALERRVLFKTQN